MSFSSSNYDFLDVIDLDSVLRKDSAVERQEKKEKSIARSGTPGKYISLDSISDDELHCITRSLITPVSFQYDIERTTDDHPYNNDSHASWQHNKILARSEHANQVLVYRSESAAIFDHLNNDEELSVDFAATDLKDFIDPILFEGVISRPVSRVPKYDSFSCEYDTSEKKNATTPPSGIESNIPSKYNLPSAAGYIRNDNDKEACAWKGSKYKQHTNITLNNNHDMKAHNVQSSAESSYTSKYSKRHSMDADVLLALRRDSDALLRRRESLLKLRKFSEGVVPPTVLITPTRSPNKSINRHLTAHTTNISPTTRFKQNLSLEKDEHYIKMDAQHKFMHNNSTSPFSHTLDKYDRSVSAIDSAFKSTTISDDKYIKRMRSVSFPDQSRRNPTIKNEQDSREPLPASYVSALLPQNAPLYNDHQSSKSRIHGSDLECAKLQRLAHPHVSMDISRTNDGQNRKSVTESAKTVLATVRQRRTDNKKGAYNRQSSLYYNNREFKSNKSTGNDKQKSALAQNLISSKSPVNSSESSTISPRKFTGDYNNIHVVTKQPHLPDRVKEQDSQYSIKQNRRHSSSLPLSSSFYGNLSTVGHQNEDASTSNKFQQVGKKHNYVAKKSALDKSKDRYVALLGKPPSL
ncbi:hypothetical protein BCR42DRAFT_401681, partial [Absidia repens]